MIDPLFWLGLSILLVAVSLTAVLVAALPALQELARAARSAQQLFDTLKRELPPTLEAIRLTGMEISDLTDEVNDGVKSASQVVKQVDQSIGGAKKQAQKVQVTTKSVLAGVKAAWKAFRRQPAGRKSYDPPPAPLKKGGASGKELSYIERLSSAQRNALELRNSGATSAEERASLNPPLAHERHRKSPDASLADASAYSSPYEDLPPLGSEDYLPPATRPDSAEETSL